MRRVSLGLNSLIISSSTGSGQSIVVGFLAPGFRSGGYWLGVCEFDKGDGGGVGSWLVALYLARK